MLNISFRSLKKMVVAFVPALTLIACSTGLFAKQTAAVELQPSQSALTLSSSGTVSLTLTAVPQTGATLGRTYGSKIAIQSGLPAGVTGSLGAPTVNSNGTISWKVALTGSRQAKAASSTLLFAVQTKDALKGTLYASNAGVTLSVVTAAVEPQTALTFSASSTIQVVQGTSATSAFTFKSSGSFSGNATLTTSGLPTGVTVHWSSNPVGMSTHAGSSTLSLSTTVGVAAGSYPFSVTASGGGLKISQSYHLAVLPSAGITIHAISGASMSSTGTTTVGIAATELQGVKVGSGGPGCTGAIMSGLPAGVTASWGQPSTASAGTVQWKLVLTGSPQAVASSGTVNFQVSVTDAASGVVFSSNQSFPLKVTFTAPTLSFSPTATRIFVGQGSNSADTFSFAAAGSLHGALNLSVSGLPSGLVASWSQNPVSLTSLKGSSNLTLSASQAVPAGGYKFTVTATASGYSFPETYTVTVEPSAGVKLALSAASLRVVPGAPASVTATARAINTVTVASSGSGVSSQVVSQLPDGVSAYWSQPSITQSGTLATSQLTLTASPSAAPGLYPITVSTTVTDQTSGMQFSDNQSFSMMVSVLAEVSIGTTTGNTVPSEFMGLSHEWGELPRWAGTPKTGINPIYRQLLTNLSAYGSSPVNLRIGGNSTDLTGYPSATLDAPLVDLANSLHNKFILGVNLGYDNVSLAEAQTENDLTSMPQGSIESVEIGNEPDEYSKNGLRWSTYAFTDYVTDFDNWAAGINPLLPSGTKLAGPAWASTGVWPANMSSFLSAEAPSLNLVTEHYYVTSPWVNAPIDVLLQANMATQGPLAVASSVSAAHANGLKFRVDELGTISDIGIEGVSDAFGSALWAVDTMFEYVNKGVDGVNWETSTGNVDHPFYFDGTTSNGVTSYTLASVSPLYYGMLFFQQATANHASLLPANVTTTSDIKFWPTVDASGTNRLTIVNKDETQSGMVMVTMPGYNVATITRLTAPSFTSTAGVTIGGQSFDTSVDGTIQGTATTETVEGTNGTFAISMPITSAALVVFSN